MIIDTIVLVVLLISAAIAFIRGFIRETLTILGVVGGLAAGWLGGPMLAPVVRGWMGVEEGAEPERLFGMIPTSLAADALAYGGIFVIVVILLSFVSHFLAESVKSLGLGAIDRTLGVLFGVARGVILLGILYLPLYLLVDTETKNEWFPGSRSYFYLEQTSAALAGFIPDHTRDKLQDSARSIDTDGARKKLEQIDLLRQTVDPEGDVKPPENSEEGDARGGRSATGYDQTFRRQMDQIIEDSTGGGSDWRGSQPARQPDASTKGRTNE